MIHHAVVLAAGRGHRLRPLTDHLPKSLVTVGTSTLIERVLAGIAGAGIEAVTVVVGYRAGDVIDHLTGAVPIAITFVHQPEPLGSGHALRLTRDAVGNGAFLLAWSDVATDPAAYATVAAAFGDDSAAVIGVVEVEDISGGGAVVFDESGAVTEVVEKPSGTPPSLWNNAGIMALGPQIWPHLDRLAPSPRGELEFTDALASLVAAGGEVTAVKLRGPWFDVGSAQSLEAARACWG